MLAKALTSKQTQWLNHVKAADLGQTSITDYALTNDLRLKSLYQWKSKLVKMGAYRPDHLVSTNSFVQVKPVESKFIQSGCTLKLANGNLVEFHGELSAVSIHSIIISASELR